MDIYQTGKTLTAVRTRLSVMTQCNGSGLRYNRSIRLAEYRQHGSSSAHATGPHWTAVGFQRQGEVMLKNTQSSAGGAGGRLDDVVNAANSASVDEISDTIQR